MRALPEPLRKLKDFLDTFNGRTLFTVETAGRREVLLELLQRIDVFPSRASSWQDF